MNYESGLRTNNGIEDLLSRLRNVLDVDGDIIECGSDRCGTSIIMAKYLKSKGMNKKVYAVDTFGKGFVDSELEEERRLGLTQAGNDAFRYNSLGYVKKKLKVSA